MMLNSARRALALLALAVTLSACVTAPTLPENYPAQEPASSRAPGNPATARARDHTELGSLYMHQARFAIALEEARIALGIDSSYAPAYNLLALTHMSLGDMSLAADNFERALSAAPGDPEISNNYGWFLCQTGQESRSYEYFLRAAKNSLYPTPTKPYTNLGICHAQKGEYPAAEQHLLKAYQLASSNTLAIFWLGEVAYRQNHLPEARQWINVLEQKIELTSEATWLALRIERKMGSREGESRYAAQLRKRFVGTPELQKLLRGEFE